MENSQNKIPAITKAIPDWLELVLTKVEGLQYGFVQIVIHDGKVTQVESTERTRFERNQR